MKQLYDITPPDELVKQWSDIEPMEDAVVQNWVNIATQAARWGADQELEACVEWFDNQSLVYHRDLEHTFRTARRPKPPSRKEQALEAISRLCASVIHDDLKNDAATIRRALEALDD